MLNRLFVTLLCAAGAGAIGHHVCTMYKVSIENSNIISGVCMGIIIGLMIKK